MSVASGLVHTTDSLPSPPTIAIQILNAVKDDEKSFDDLADIVKADPALATQILKITNSSLYGLPQNVKSLAQATGMLGVKALKNIALSFVIVNNFEKTSKDSFDLDNFWRHSITTGVAAEMLATKLRLKNQDIFVTGLLQDIGILLMFTTRPCDIQKVLDESRVSGKPLWQVEEEILGFNHAEAGAQLLESWNLPASIHRAIRNHHTIDKDCKYHETSKLLSFADRVASIYHGNNVSRTVQEVHELLKKVSSLSDAEIDQLIDLVGEKSCEMMELFTIDPGNMQPISAIMQQSKDELKKLNLSYEQVVFELQQAKQHAEKLALELKKANEKLSEMAYYDELTGLFNHRYFQQTLDDEIYRTNRFKKPLSLLLLDIDFFKKVNDTYGHLVGDIVLRQVSIEMNRLVRQSDVVARYGGEEFAIVLPETGLKGAKVIGQRIRRGVERLEIIHEDSTIPVTISIGAASSEMADVGTNKSELISISDKGLYLAKRRGRNRLEVVGEDEDDQ